LVAQDKGLSREDILRALLEPFKRLDYVHAFWEGGATCFGRVDEWSDLDLYVLVDDDRVDETFSAVESTLASLSKIRDRFMVGETPWKGIYQAFYRLEDTSEYLLIDLAILTMSAPDKFMETDIHGPPIFYINKSDSIGPVELDRKALAIRVQKRLARLSTRRDIFLNFVQKEINRGNFIEAVDLYKGVVLDSLTEALRIRYNPIHHDFKTRYIHYELPEDVVEKLQRLYFVKDEDDLQEKFNEASEWLRETIREIEEEGVDSLIEKRA